MDLNVFNYHIAILTVVLNYFMMGVDLQLKGKMLKDCLLSMRL